MLITFDPIALNLGQLAVRWFGLLALIGLGVAIYLGWRALARHKVPSWLALDALAWGLPAGLVVARLVYVLGWWDFYLTHASELTLLNVDGLSVWGGLVGGGVIVAARLGRSNDPLLRRRAFDAVSPGAALGIAIGQLGAFLDGHGQGRPADLAWATQYANRLAATPDFGVPRHPAQLYLALAALALWIVLLALPARLPAGTRLAVFCVVFGVVRVALGAVRLDPPFLFGLQIEQILALGAVVFGMWYGLRPGLTRVAWLRRQAPATAAGQSPVRKDSLAA